MPAVPFSYRQYAGNGSTTTFSVPFPYLLKSHVKVYIGFNILDGTYSSELADGTGFTWSSGTQIQCTTAPASGQTLTVIRVTPNTTRLVDWQDGSNLISNDLDTADLQNLYVIQEQQDRNDAGITQSTNAQTAAAAATAASTTATTTANAASTAAATATTTANAASASAATALSQSNTAIANSASALTASANAVTTANTAATNAASAVTTAGTANTNATAAVNTANTAASNASTALSQSSTALSNSATALSTANTAASNASTALTNSSNAVTTANTASTNASNAVTTANTASTNATAALNAVASSLQYVLVANVAAIPSSPANNYAIEVADSTGVESFSPLANRPAGFVGDVGLSVRMQYSTTGPTWNWLNYFPNNAETRYLKLAGGTLTGQLRADDSTSVAAPVIAFDGDTNTGLAHTGADELALVTGGTARLTVDPSGAVAVTNALSVGGQAAVVTNDARLSDTRTPTDGSVTNAKVSASAAIAGSKISPDFGSQNRTSTGTSTAASFIPTSSTAPTNGVYLPAANSVAISTGGSGRLFVDASGRLLVGASTARDISTHNAKLQLEGVGYNNATFQIYGNQSNSEGAYLFFGKSRGTTIGSNAVVQSGDTLGDIRFYGADGTSNIWASSIRCEVDGTPGTNDMPARLVFYTTSDNAANPAERMRLDSSGRLGIGVTDPGSYFSDARNLVVGNTAGDAGVTIASNSSNKGTIAFADGTTGDQAYRGYIQYSHNGDSLSFATTGTERARIDSSGRLLVGTSSSSANARAVIQGRTTSATDQGVLYLQRGSSGPGVVADGSGIGEIWFADSNGYAAANIMCLADNTWGGAGSDYPGRLVFSTTADGASSPTERMRIKNTGDVLCYGDNPIKLASAASAGTSATLIDGFYSATSVTTGTRSFLVYTNGNVQNTNNSYTALSDIKLKENIVDANSQWDDIKALQVRNYNLKEGQTHRQIGLIAQEVEPISPGLVYESPDRDKDGNDLGTVTKSVNYSVLYMKAVKALQEAMERIETLEAKVAALESA